MEDLRPLFDDVHPIYKKIDGELPLGGIKGLLQDLERSMEMGSELVLGLALLEACEDGDLDAIEGLLAKGADPNSRDILSGRTCLHFFARRGPLDASRLLLENGANPNLLTDNTSASPLAGAALSGNIEMVRLLLAWGARLSVRDVSSGLLQECAEAGLHSIVDLIEKEGRGA